VQGDEEAMMIALFVLAFFLVLIKGWKVLLGMGCFVALGFVFIMIGSIFSVWGGMDADIIIKAFLIFLAILFIIYILGGNLLGGIINFILNIFNR